MWEEKNNTLYRKFEFKDFSEAFAFMTRVALAAEKADHHPKWTNVYNTVEMWLNTHDAGDVVTAKDHALAKKIDALN
ncbi:MAG: 4a-hydroxytetrahydrobiopterin dehydratase [Ferruginibacter sp.]|nr:4a-hydroxytetrahydrobiopterin dehydratase [Ferruginibacter sp.]